MLELLGGDSLPRSSFADSIQLVEGITFEVLAQRCSQIAHLRLCHLESHIAFLASKCTIKSVAYLEPETKHTSSFDIEIRYLNGEPVMIDGVVAEN